MCIYNCFYSGWVNRYDEYFDYTVPPGHVMRGWTSIHDNGAEYVVKLLWRSYTSGKLIENYHEDIFFHLFRVNFVHIYNLVQG